MYHVNKIYVKKNIRLKKICPGCLRVSIPNMPRLKSYVQYHPKQVIGVLLALFLLILALSVWAWCLPDPRKATFASLRGEALDLQSQSVYPLDTLATPALNFPPVNSIPRIVHRVVQNTEKHNVKLPKLTHFDSWQHVNYTSAQQHEFVAHTFGNEWPDILHAYNLCRLTELQLCLFKYLVVYHHGGLYLDANALSNKSCDAMLSSDKAFVAPCTPPTHVDLYGDMTQGQGEYQSWWVMAPPKSIFLWQVVWQVVRNVFGLHTQGQHECKFTQLSHNVTDSTAGSVCYTYMACKFKDYVTVCKNDFLALRHDVTTQLGNTFTGTPGQHLGNLPVQLVYVRNHEAKTTLLSKHKIPAIIHQTHESRWVTPAMAKAMQSLRDHAPYCEYRFYDDNERRRFIATHYPNASDAYDALVSGCYRADLFRAVVVYTLGGVYFDSGFSPLEGTDLFNNVIAETDEFVFPIDEWIQGLLTGFFAATRHHPYLKKIIDHVVDNIESRKTFAHHTGGFLKITGPKAYADALQGYLPSPLTEGTHHPNVHLLFFPVGTSVYKKGKLIYKTQYNGYYDDQKVINRGVPHYKELWSRNQIYKTSVMKDLQRLRTLSATRWPSTIPILYINLDYATQRNETTKMELQDVSDNITRVSAIDGNQIQSSNVVLINDFTNLTPGEIGCTASHLKAIKHAFDMNVEKVIICEDDVCFAPMRVWTQMQIDEFCTSVTSDVGLVLLCWGNHQYGTELKIDKISTLGFMFGTVAYIITRKGMSDILSHAQVTNSIIHLRKSTSVTHGVADGYLYMLTNVATSNVPLALPNNAVNKTQITGREDGDPDHSHFAQMEEIVRLSITISTNHNNQVCKGRFDLDLAYKYISSRPKRHWPLSIPVLYINLERSLERRRSVEFTLAQVGVSGERVNAFDGKMYDDATKTIKGVTITSDFPTLTPCELATTASHLTAIKVAYDKGFDMVLICEDDVSFAPLGLWPQNQINAFVSTIHASNGIVLLYWLGKGYGSELKLSPIPNVRNDLYAATAYVITRHGMAQVLSHVSITATNIHWSKTHDKQQGEADNYLFSITNVATSGVPLVFADNTINKQTITDRPADHPEYQRTEFKKAVQAMCSASCAHKF